MRSDVPREPGAGGVLGKMLRPGERLSLVECGTGMLFLRIVPPDDDSRVEWTNTRCGRDGEFIAPTQLFRYHSGLSYGVKLRFCFNAREFVWKMTLVRGRVWVIVSNKPV